MSYQTTNTFARTYEQTITHVDVRNVMWKIRSDIGQLRIFHSIFSVDYEENLSSDLFQWVYRGYVDQIRFEFYKPSNLIACFAINYLIIRGQILSTNDDAGTIRYLDLKGTSFRVRITYSQAWLNLSSQEKDAFYTDLNLSWGPLSFELQYSGGSWASDKTYSSNSLGARRSIYSV